MNIKVYLSETEFILIRNIDEEKYNMVKSTIQENRIETISDEEAQILFDKIEEEKRKKEAPAVPEAVPDSSSVSKKGKRKKTTTTKTKSDSLKKTKRNSKTTENGN